MASKWFKLASLYFITGIGLGLVYAAYPRAGRSVLGTWTFWLYQIGLPFLLASMFMVQIPSTRGFAHVLTFSGGGALALGIILFIVNVFGIVHDEDLRLV
ncbi:hypothetical protein [Sporosarcina trichiuri]|uniref:hypothetical protein n=1 Tax=Sporosarcina trichiuri TaxID=3056445 RepID=UPI0025B3F58B|nr:hypothetical protein [Sporosarcina sp. 0.2-SM1T-5]WJY27743.1 hypothetical protein QWT68_01715 [Sporosarcina sp. 0.2-SM1T-5]